MDNSLGSGKNDLICFYLPEFTDDYTFLFLNICFYDFVSVDYLSN